MVSVPAPRLSQYMERSSPQPFSNLATTERYLHVSAMDVAVAMGALTASCCQCSLGDYASEKWR